MLPPLNLLTDKKIDHISLQCNEITSLIRNLNPNKATGSDEISGRMLLLCDNSVVLPLKIIFEKSLASCTYPDRWKLANVTPIVKKGDKQLIKNYRPISLLPICGKILKKLSSTIFTNTSMQTTLLSKINLSFVQEIPHLTNYYILLMKFTRPSMTLNP